LPKLDEGRCRAIGDCIAVYPTSAIEKGGFTFWKFRHIHAVLAHPEWCNGCHRCVDACPVHAWRFPYGDDA